ncbi:MAG: mannonate dehydratase [Clostridiaceae bacterium]
MILTDYFLCEKDIVWDYARQCGVENGVIRLPETEAFDVADYSHWKAVYKMFTDFGIKPIVIEPMPNRLHDHIKTGDEKRNESIEKVIKMFPIMNKLDIRIICFNFMAHIGWLRTSKNIKERGGALVTGFNINDFIPTNDCITSEQLWYNYIYFINAVIPYAEKYNISLALHPDDPPVDKLADVSRIMINKENIDKAMNIAKSDKLGLTMCQATYEMMGEGLYKVIPHFAEKIFFVHFRNVVGNKFDFHETFHDNGQLDMYKLLVLYKQCGVNVPIRVDHVPAMAGEDNLNAGYTANGRIFAIGYLKGLLDAIA